jgi:uncharacterized protein
VNPAARWPLASFIALVLALELLAVAAQLSPDALPFVLVLVPTIAAVAVATSGEGWAGVRRLLARLGRWRVGIRWYAWAVGIPLVGTLLIDVAGLMSGQADLGELAAAVTPAALLVPIVVLLPAFFEELGWRGFGVQTAADNGWAPALAALVVGLVFIAIHLPLYLPGQIYDNLPMWPVPLMLLGYAAFLSWIYLGTGGSVLLAAIGHALANGATPLTWGLDPVWVWQARGVIFGLIGIAFFIVLATSGRLLQGDVQHQEIADAHGPVIAG